MKEYNRYSPQAGTAVMGQVLRQMGVCAEIEEKVRIPMQTRKYAPAEKINSILMGMLAGISGLIEMNTQVRADLALQQACGLAGCAEQSTLSRTLDACTEENVRQLRSVNETWLQRHGRAARHDFQRSLLILDVDLSALPCGKQAEQATQGYFPQKRGARGRQVGRVLASPYDEIIWEGVYAGNRQLVHAQRELIENSEEVLHLDESQRPRTLIRMDSGGSRNEEVNWLLERGYQVLTKITNYKRCKRLAASVQTWFTTATRKDHEFGWVQQPYAYARPTWQLAIRFLDARGKTHLHILILTPLSEWASDTLTPQQRAEAMLQLYDQRGGGVETSFRKSNEGLNWRKRNKRKKVAQEMLLVLAQLAYNLLSWLAHRLSTSSTRLGFKRLMRDVLGIPGSVEIAPSGLLSITLSPSFPWASTLTTVLFTWFEPNKLCLICA